MPHPSPPPCVSHTGIAGLPNDALSTPKSIASNNINNNGSNDVFPLSPLTAAASAAVAAAPLAAGAQERSAGELGDPLGVSGGPVTAAVEEGGEGGKEIGRAHV